MIDFVEVMFVSNDSIESDVNSKIGMKATLPCDVTEKKEISSLFLPILIKSCDMIYCDT